MFFEFCTSKEKITMNLGTLWRYEAEITIEYSGVRFLGARKKSTLPSECNQKIRALMHRDTYKIWHKVRTYNTNKIQYK